VVHCVPIFVKLIHQVRLHLVRLPHIVANDMVATNPILLTVLIILRHRCIRQVLELVPRIVGVVVLTREPQVRSPPDPNRQRVDTGDDDPLPDIEFLPQNDQRPFNVFLNNPARKVADPDPLHHLFNIRVDFDAATSGLGAGFDDPEVAVVSQTELFGTEQGLELRQHLSDLGLEHCGFHVGKSTLKRSVPGCSHKVNTNVWLAQIVVHVITNVIKLTGRELFVGL